MTQEEITQNKKRMHRTVVLFMVMALSGVAVQSLPLIIGGLIGAIASSRHFATRLTCRHCGSSLEIDPPSGNPSEACPGCDRSEVDH